MQPNFYIKISELEAMKTEYLNAIERMNTLYFDLEHTINTLEESGAWEGGSYTSFINEFDSWKGTYLKSINRCIILKNFIADVIVSAEAIIADRDTLL